MSDDNVITIRPFGSRVRITAAGHTLAESDDALMLSESGYAPVCYVPAGDVRRDLLQRSAQKTHCPYKGDATYWTLDSGEDRLENIAWSYEAPLQGVAKIKGYFAFYPNRAKIETAGRK